MPKLKTFTIKWPLIIIAILSIAMMVFVFGCNKEKVEKSSTKAKTKTLTGDAALFNEVITQDQYPAWIKKYLNTRKWKNRDYEKKLSRKILEDSLDVGTIFMLNNQKEEGNFNYEYDWVNKTFTKGDNQVRQAGALWGMGLLYQNNPDPKVKASIDKGLEFFFKYSKEGPEPGTLTVEYPGDPRTSTGTVALVALTIVEYLRGDKKANTLSAEYKAKLNEKLDGYLKFLVWCRLDNKHFAKDYQILNKMKGTKFSPYFDGEIMLCLIKAAKYTGHKELIPLIEDSAPVLAKEYTIDEWRKNPDSDMTKGFFQWSCMSFWEYQDAGWKNSEMFSDYVLAMTWWMIHTHRTLKRSKGTGYAYEGILHGYQIATARNMTNAISDIGYTVDRGMYKLTTWQVRGPLNEFNKFLVDNKDKSNDKIAIGGFMNHKKQAPLRIDVTQHTLHGNILTLKYAYTE